MVACSTTFKGRRCLCSVRSDVWKLVSKSFPLSFRRERGKTNGQQYNSLFSILPSIHYYINASTVIPLQFMYVIYKQTYIHTDIYTTGSVTRCHTTKFQNKNNIGAAPKNSKKYTILL